MRPPRRIVRRALCGYGVAVATSHVVGFTVVAAARAVGGDPRARDAGSIRNLRRVDDRVWAGAQPDAGEYRDLADQGVRLVVDLRTGARDDPRRDDPGYLRSLGVDYVSLPVPDGRVPSRATVDALVRAVERAGGGAFLHCGGGVGRSTTAQGAYLAATGRRPRRAELLAVGPMALEQLWFVATGCTRVPRIVSALSIALDAPRRIRGRIRSWPRRTLDSERVFV